jgi:hypothetical protein
MEINQLVEITDVTERIRKACHGLTGPAFHEALRKEKTRIESACAGSPAERCDVVTLFRGGRYDLYRYRRYQDVRLVFAPELSIAFFGGDPDNFTFPRYDLDVSFLRVYEEGRPARTPHHFSWSKRGAAEGELTFVTGHPGNTSRSMTTEQLLFERDTRLLTRLLYLSELRGVLTEFQNRGAESKRISTAALFSVENSFKAIRGRHAALTDPAILLRKSAEEKDLQARIAADPALSKAVGDAYGKIARATGRLREIYPRLVYLEGLPAGSGRSLGFQGTLFGIARLLARSSEERRKPNETRLREFSKANLPALEEELFSPAPIHDELEIAFLTFSLTKLRETLGPDDPVVGKVLGKESPMEVAKALVSGTRLKDPLFRKKVYEGKLRGAEDPMIRFALRIDAESRAIRKRYEEGIESELTRSGEEIARARFALVGTDVYPDATFTLRLSYGRVAGYEENGRRIDPFTTIEGAFARHTGRDPFALPPSWLAARGKLHPRVPLNFVTTNDIIGGNSGSPVINRNAEIVGLIFDGNIQSLGGEYEFDERVSRAVAVSSQGLTETLGKVYGADRLVREIRPPRPALKFR